MMKRLWHLDLHIYIAICMFVLLVSGFFFSGDEYESYWKGALFFAVLIGSLPLAIQIIASLRKGMFGVDVIAITAIITALFTGEIVAASIVLFMLSGGEALEVFAEKRARSSLERLLKRAPSKASLKKDGEVTEIAVSLVQVGDILAIAKGDVIPVDGIVEEGMSVVDESVVNGEPIPRDISKGDIVVSGTTNKGDFFTIRATSTYEKSVFSGIVRLVKQAEEEKAPTVRLANKYSTYFTAFTFGLAFLALLKDPKLATAVLVVATPCPLILAAPIAFIGGMSRSARRGIIVKHGGVFELIAKTKAFFFDKTGTLTLGTPNVDKVLSLKEGVHEDDVIRFAVTLEQQSAHVFAQGIIAYARKKHIHPLVSFESKETVSQGIEGKIDSKTYVLGKLSFLESKGVSISEEIKKDAQGTKIYLAEDGSVIGAIHFADNVRKEAQYALHELKAVNSGAQFVLITGDGKERAEEIGHRLGFSDIQSNCLPEDKLKLIKEYEEKGKPVAMIGDGINDAPSLAGASVGVALGSHGATAATDIADAVIMVDSIERVAELARISNRTLLIAKQSMGVGMGLSVIAMGAAYFGYLPAVEGAILQEGIDVLVILNALRAL